MPFPTAESISSEDDLNIFIEEGYSAEERSASLKNNLCLPSSLSRRDISESFSNLKKVSSSCSALSPSTRSLASHISMDSLRRRAVLDSQMDEDVSDAASVLSSISTPRNNGLKYRKHKPRIICTCGAAKARRARKPSAYRHYDEDGNLIIQQQESVDDVELGVETLGPDNQSDAENDEQVPVKKSTGFWSFLKF